MRVFSLKIKDFRIRGQELGYASARVPRLGLSTNGTMLSPEICELVARHVDEIRVSLDGSCARVHDAIRGRGSFDRAIMGLKRLGQLGRPAIIKTVITRRNLDDVPRLVRLARSLGAQLELSSFSPIGAGADNARQLQVAAEDLLATYKKIWLLAEYYEVPSASFNTFCAQFTTRAARSCGPGLRYVLVDCDGEVYPCEALQQWSHRLGNLTRGESYLPEALSRVEEAGFSVDQRNGCSTCTLRYLCKGGCAAESMAAPGRRGGASSLCRFFHRVLPPIAAGFDPGGSSWRNLRQVFGEEIDLRIIQAELSGSQITHEELAS